MAQNQFGQSLGAMLGQFAFGGADRKSAMKGMLDGAHAGAYDASAKNSLASALKNEAEAAQVRAENESRNPANLLRNAMTGYGVPTDEAGAVENFLRSGRLGGKYEPAIDGFGPAMPAPAWASKLPDVARSMQGIQNALTIGDKSSKSIADAGAINREGRLSDAIIAGTANRNTVGGAQAAVAGKDLFNTDSTGSVLDRFTGALDTSNPMAGATINLRKEQAGAQKANAVQSYASADNSRASAAKTRSDLDRGVKTGDIVVQTDADGRIMLINKLTGISRPATSDEGQTLRAGGKGGATGAWGKPLTEGQAKAVAFASRMQNSNQIIDKLGESGVFASVPGSRGMAGGVINAIQPEARQQLDQAKRDFINAVLRRESGAVISDAEFDNAEKQYFPQINEGKKQRDQKALNRRIALQGMKADIPAGAGDMVGDVLAKSAAPASGGAYDADKEKRYQEWKARQAK